MNVNKDYDLICVGGGIMSATLVVLAKLLHPELNILVLEKLDKVAQESSAAWNNAGTGHSALCELNYTPEKDGKIDLNNAIKICSQFEISKQFWAYLVKNNLLQNPKDFVNPIAHHSWVTGENAVEKLKKRYEAMKRHFAFEDMIYTENKEQMAEWFPLITNERSDTEPMAATRIDRGTEINFGALTEKLFALAKDHLGVKIHCNQHVLDIDPDDNIEWSVKVKNTHSGDIQYLDAHHVFIGAGGGALLLLQKVEIDEKDGYGGFPVSGQWLVCKNEDIINQHHAKVYSSAGLGAPPMSVPHLDTRYIDGKKSLLFGPFAGFSPKFLKQGSNLDLIKSINFDNIPSMFGAFWHNLPLTRYLIEQVTMNHEDRMNQLRKFVKNAKSEDWELLEAGQRVQIIKRDAYEGGKLQFGTEVVSSQDGSITALLGASPGASTAVAILLEVLEIAFTELVNSKKGKNILNEMVPFWKQTITRSSFQSMLNYTKEALQL